MKKKFETASDLVCNLIYDDNDRIKQSEDIDLSELDKQFINKDKLKDEINNKIKYVENLHYIFNEINISEMLGRTMDLNRILKILESEDK